MKYLLSSLAIFLLVTSCDQLDCNACKGCNNLTDLKESSAQVGQMNGWHVFLMSQPLHEHTVVGHIANEWVDEMAQSGKKKKLGQVLLGMLETASQNITVDQIITKMVENAKAKYPDADGVIFTSNLMEANVIKFN